MEKIYINIWDDFWEDGYVPEGEVQCTYAYVDEIGLTHEECEYYLKQLLPHLKEIKHELYFHDTKKDYDPETVKQCIEFYGDIYFKRWEIKLFITHSQLHELVEELNSLNIIHNNKKVIIISES